MRRPAHTICACIGSLLCLPVIALALAGCSATDGETVVFHTIDENEVVQAASDAGVSRVDVAVVVNGEVITQDMVHDRVQQMRTTNGLIDGMSYSKYLDAAGMTEFDVWKTAVISLVEETLIEQDAAARGIEIDESAVAERIESLSSRYPSHDAWISALSASGYTEESYKEAVRADIISSKLQETVVSEVTPTEEQIREYAVVVAPSLSGRRSSQILFSQSDFETATEVLHMLDGGGDFATLAGEYSIDGSAANGGDMGWDCLTTFVDEYQEALDGLQPGEYSRLVKSQFGYHIVYCTDIYTPSYLEDGSLDISAIPDDLMDYIESAMVASLEDDAYVAYITSLEANAAMAVFDMAGNQVDLTDVGFTI